MPEPCGLLITWTCYGTWLPGDPRGYVSQTRMPDGGWLPKENMPGAPYRADDPLSRNGARKRQEWPTVNLTVEQARCVAESLVKAAVDRGWRIARAAVMGITYMRWCWIVPRMAPQSGES